MPRWFFCHTDVFLLYCRGVKLVTVIRHLCPGIFFSEYIIVYKLSIYIPCTSQQVVFISFPGCDVLCLPCCKCRYGILDINPRNLHPSRLQSLWSQANSSTGIFASLGEVRSTYSSCRPPFLYCVGSGQQDSKSWHWEMVWLRITMSKSLSGLFCTLFSLCPTQHCSFCSTVLQNSARCS